MQIDWQISPVSEWQADAVIFFSFEKPSAPLPGFKRWTDRMGAWLPESMAFNDFQGKAQQAVVCYGPLDQPIARVIIAGLGPSEKFDIEKLRGAAASALRKCRELRLSRPALPLWAFEGLPVNVHSALEEALISGVNSLYRFDALKTKDVDPSSQLESITLIDEVEPTEDLLGVPPVANSIVSGISFARDLVVAPANQVTPGFLLDTARSLAETYNFRLNAINLAEAQALGMGAFVAVAQGSREPAYIIILEHNPEGSDEESPLLFVGKGITFDTGGISLKPSNKLEAMKQDMAGAAAVLGAFDAIGTMKLRRRVIGILPCTENMPDGKAYKPGDVVNTLSGLTVEVISTDAEGRMILSDSLTYAQRYKPALIVDIATLTGACIVALGNEVAGVMGNSENLIRKIQEIGATVGEKVWPLPLWDLYFEYIKSDVADVKNVGDRSAGAIVGGIFLRQFVPEEIPWAHLDIAGTAWTEKDTGILPKGATGFGVRILVELARQGFEMERAQG